MAASRELPFARSALGLAVLGGVVIFGWTLPLFHMVSLKPPTSNAPSLSAGSASFDAKALAAKLWKTDLPAATRHAVELSALVGLLKENPEAAKTKFAKSAGLGTAYYFVRGGGKVIAHERNHLRIALDAADADIVALRIGAIFGNSVRDGCGVLDVNSFPGLQEFNELSAELNALVEKNVLPALRDKAIIGATVVFAGCAETPESAADADEPLLTIVPVQAEVR